MYKKLHIGKRWSDIEVKSIKGEDDGIILNCVRLGEKIRVQLMRAAESSKHQQQIQQENNKNMITAGLLETYSHLLLWLGTKLFQCKSLIYYHCMIVLVC